MISLRHRITVGDKDKRGAAPWSGWLRRPIPQRPRGAALPLRTDEAPPVVVGLQPMRVRRQSQPYYFPPSEIQP